MLITALWPSCLESNQWSTIIFIIYMIPLILAWSSWPVTQPIQPAAHPVLFSKVPTWSQHNLLCKMSSRANWVLFRVCWACRSVLSFTCLSTNRQMLNYLIREKIPTKPIKTQNKKTTTHKVLDLWLKLPWGVLKMKDDAQKIQNKVKKYRILTSTVLYFNERAIHNKGPHTIASLRLIKNSMDLFF